jgi:multiple sugar transport system substrate-binding protein
MGIVTERFGDQTNFGNGRTLFTISSSSGFPFYRQAIEAGASFPWSVGPLPYVTDEPVMNIYGASVSMPAGLSAERQVATWLFLKYYTSTDVQAAGRARRTTSRCAPARGGPG